MSALALATAHDPDATVAAILAVQEISGLIPWSEGGRADPWNHVEAAMALAAAGEFSAAQRAYRWLADSQRHDGSWFAAYRASGEPLERHIDTNAVAYLGTGLWHLLHASGDLRFCKELFSVLERAVGYLLAHVGSDGWLPWSCDQAGAPAGLALLSGSASAAQSLAAAASLASALGHRRSGWAQAAARLSSLVAGAERRFADKSVFAMDWYYPVLSGALDAQAGRRRLLAGRQRFVLAGRGVRCRSDGNWVTAAETAECAIAHWRAGLCDEANELLSWTTQLRNEDGSYTTGIVHPEGAEFPQGERTSYSAAAVLLACDVVFRGPSASVFAPLA